MEQARGPRWTMMGSIDVGYRTFLEEGGEAFGAVRAADPTHDALVIYVENAGDFRVPAAAVRSAHDGKVILDPGQLDRRMREAIAHAHDREEPGV